MGVGIYPVTESEIAAAAYGSDGKMLAAILDAADRRAASLGVAPLMSFFGFDPGAVSEEFDIETGEPPTEKWFSAAEGLTTIEALIRDVKENREFYFPSAVSERSVQKLSAPTMDGAVEDLKAMRKVLQAASRENLKWYLAIDF
ncbi:MAG TPA: hypothetical protein VIL74_00165 [Pyrinomonadaceae bacterium]|jgi:hypothetical protein